MNYSNHKLFLYLDLNASSTYITSITSITSISQKIYKCTNCNTMFYHQSNYSHGHLYEVIEVTEQNWVSYNIPNDIKNFVPLTCDEYKIKRLLE